MKGVSMTTSFCPVCYKTIPATIHVVDAVYMTKDCPEHGHFIGMVERDPMFYHHWRQNNGSIYDGHLVDVTTRCNLNCRYCFYEKGSTDIPLDSILAECRKTHGPYFLTGGEPTLRQDLPEIIEKVSEIGATYVLTNGTGFLDRNYLTECCKHLIRPNGFMGIGLSYHAELEGFHEVIENLKAENVKPSTCFFVIDSLDHLPGIKAFAENHRGMFGIIRIKCASALWNESHTSRVFSSDVVKWFMCQGETKLPEKGKSTYLPFLHNGIVYAAVNWFDSSNVDLGEIDCPPTYTAKNGITCDFVKAALINEGMAKGWLDGEWTGEGKKPHVFTVNEWDIPEIEALSKRAFDQMEYTDVRGYNYDRDHIVRGITNGVRSLDWIATKYVKDGLIQGFMLVRIEEINYYSTQHKRANEVVWHGDPASSRQVLIQKALLEDMIVRTAGMDLNVSIDSRHPEMAKLLERMGFTKAGEVFTRRQNV